MTYVFSHGYSKRSGFPHSDIYGSKLVCQLPVAFRRLPRPSSPVIAKASTTCTCSLDPITSLSRSPEGDDSRYRLSSRICAVFQLSRTCVRIILRYIDTITTRITSTPISNKRFRYPLYYFFQIVKERQPISATSRSSSDWLNRQ